MHANYHRGTLTGAGAGVAIAAPDAPSDVAPTEAPAAGAAELRATVLGAAAGTGPVALGACADALGAGADALACTACAGTCGRSWAGNPGAGGAQRRQARRVGWRQEHRFGIAEAQTSSKSEQLARIRHMQAYTGPHAIPAKLAQCSAQEKGQGTCANNCKAQVRATMPVNTPATGTGPEPAGPGTGTPSGPFHRPAQTTAQESVASGQKRQ
jgi:hypothetical protein